MCNKAKDMIRTCNGNEPLGKPHVCSNRYVQHVQIVPFISMYCLKTHCCGFMECGKVRKDSGLEVIVIAGVYLGWAHLF